MLQEIITYKIVATAVIVSGYKLYKRFSRKKPKAVDFKKASLANPHNCSDCAAQCMLRDKPQHTIAKSSEICDTNYTKK
jgi:hypothetical protein